MRLQLLLIALACWLTAALAGTTLVFDITDQDPITAQALANALVANFASYNLAINNVTILGDSLTAQVPTLAPTASTTNTASPSASSSGIKPPKGSSYQDWAPAVIVCAIAVVIGIIVLVIAFIRRSSTTRDQKMTLALCIMLLTAPTGTQSLSRTYSHCKILLPSIDYRVYWEGSGNTLQIALQAKSQGWLGFGISQSTTPGTLMDSAGQGPYGSDITMGYVGTPGDCPNGCAFDYWTTLHSAPNKDTRQNVTFVAGEKNSTHLTIEFDRLFTSGGDPDQDKNIPMNANVMTIFASNVNEIPTNQGLQWSYHGSANRNGMLVNFGAASDCNRAYTNIRVLMTLDTPFAFFNFGDFFVNLAAKMSVGPERFVFVSSDDNTFTCPNCIIDNFVMPGFSLTPQKGETNYICYDFAFDVDTTYHAIRFDPFISPGSESVVHHVRDGWVVSTANWVQMILYSLSAPSGKTGFWDCSSMPGGAQPLTVWAVGAGNFILPDNVGFKVGKDAVRYVTLQMHYNNPSLGTFVDNSGVKVYRTATLRSENGGWGFLGQHTSKISLKAGVPYPPGLQVSGNCPSSTVNAWVSAGDVHVFAYAMHAHGTARKIQTDHWRAGGKIHTYINDPYSFSFQHLVVGDWTITKGDSLNTTCWYDTTDRTSDTKGGEASSEEMCYAIVAFYCPDPCPAVFGGGACIA